LGKHYHLADPSPRLISSGVGRKGHICEKGSPYGRIDVMINNAGLIPHSPLERLKIDDWNRTIDVNTRLLPFIGYPRTLNALRVIDEVVPPTNLTSAASTAH